MHILTYIYYIHTLIHTYLYMCIITGNGFDIEGGRVCVCIYIYTMYIYTHTHTHLCMYTSIIIGEVYDVEGGRVVSSGGNGVGGGGANRQPYAYPAVPGNKNSQTKFSNIGALVYLSLCLLQTDFLADPAYLIRLESISFLFGFFGLCVFMF